MPALCVLSRFKSGEKAAIEETIATAAQAVLHWVKLGTEAAMNKFNGPADDEKKKKKPGEPAT